MNEFKTSTFEEIFFKPLNEDRKILMMNYEIKLFGRLLYEDDTKLTEILKENNILIDKHTYNINNSNIKSSKYFIKSMNKLYNKNQFILYEFKRRLHKDLYGYLYSEGPIYFKKFYELNFINCEDCGCYIKYENYQLHKKRLCGTFVKKLKNENYNLCLCGCSIISYDNQKLFNHHINSELHKTNLQNIFRMNKIWDDKYTNINYENTMLRIDDEDDVFYIITLDGRNEEVWDYDDIIYEEPKKQSKSNKKVRFLIDVDDDDDY